MDPTSRSWIIAALLAVAILLIGAAVRRGRRKKADGIPRPQPTESEAIVAAERAGQTPFTPLVPPVPLPVDEAARPKTSPFQGS